MSDRVRNASTIADDQNEAAWADEHDTGRPRSVPLGDGLLAHVEAMPSNPRRLVVTDRGRELAAIIPMDDL